jgi:hypothetical protein
MDHAVVLWGVMFLYSFSAPFLQKAIVNQHLSVRIAYLCYILLSAALFAYVPQHIRAFNFPPATSFFIMCETMRLWMKMHSYLMVNRSVPCDGFCSNNSQPVLLMCCGLDWQILTTGQGGRLDGPQCTGLPAQCDVLGVLLFLVGAHPGLPDQLPAQQDRPMGVSRPPPDLLPMRRLYTFR